MRHHRLIVIYFLYHVTLAGVSPETPLIFLQAPPSLPVNTLIHRCLIRKHQLVIKLTVPVAFQSSLFAQLEIHFSRKTVHCVIRLRGSLI
jgi:hypothetical protein